MRPSDHVASPSRPCRDPAKCPTHFERLILNLDEDRLILVVEVVRTLDDADIADVLWSESA